MSLVDIVTLIVLGASITIGIIMFWCDVTEPWNYVFRRLAGTWFRKMKVQRSHRQMQFQRRSAVMPER